MFSSGATTRGLMRSACPQQPSSLSSVFHLQADESRAGPTDPEEQPCS